MTLRALSPGFIAVGGGDLGLVVNGRVSPMWTVLSIKEGDVIGFNALHSGMRAYVGVAGGFDAPLILGSRSAYLRGALGTALKKGDEIRSLSGKKATGMTGKTLPPRFVPDRNMKKSLPGAPGPPDGLFQPGRYSGVFHCLLYDFTGLRPSGHSHRWPPRWKG